MIKSTGIVRRLDELGRIVIPIEIRNKFDISEKDQIEIYVNHDTIVLKKYQSVCIFCGSRKNLREYKNKPICDSCHKEITNSKEI